MCKKFDKKYSLQIPTRHLLVPLCLKLLCIKYYESTKIPLHFVNIYQSIRKKNNFDQLHELTYLSPFCLVNQILIFFKVKTVLNSVYRFLLCFYRPVEMFKQLFVLFDEQLVATSTRRHFNYNTLATTPGRNKYSYI